MDELRRYELYVIFQPELQDDQLEGHIGRIDTYLTGNGGEIIEVVRKGKRRLAYPINKFNQGIDVIYQVNLPSRQLEVLERQLNLYEDVIRYLVVRRDDLEGQAPRLTASDEEIAEEVAALQAQPVDLEGFDPELEVAAAAPEAAETVERNEFPYAAPEPEADASASQPTDEFEPTVETPVTEEGGA